MESWVVSRAEKGGFWRVGRLRVSFDRHIGLCSHLALLPNPFPIPPPLKTVISEPCHCDVRPFTSALAEKHYPPSIA